MTQPISNRSEINSLHEAVGGEKVPHQVRGKVGEPKPHSDLVYHPVDRPVVLLPIWVREDVWGSVGPRLMEALKETAKHWVEVHNNRLSKLSLSGEGYLAPDEVNIPPLQREAGRTAGPGIGHETDEVRYQTPITEFAHGTVEQFNLRMGKQERRRRCVLQWFPIAGDNPAHPTFVLRETEQIPEDDHIKVYGPVAGDSRLRAGRNVTGDVCQ